MRVLLGLLLSSSIVACTAGDNGDDDESTPTPTPTVSPSPTATPVPTNCTTARNELIYVFDAIGDLHTFDPELIGVSDPFVRVGTPDCTPGAALPPFVGTGIPMSLAFASTEYLHALYTSGEVFRISAINGTCTATGFTVQQMSGGTTWSVFGAAFSADVAGEFPERMWISGGNTDGSLGALGVVSTGSLAVTTVANLGGGAPNRPELMGLSDATLWGFFPEADGGFVQEIDKTNGALLGTASPISIPGGNSMIAWGAAQWGGDFHVFVTLDDGMTTNSTVHRVNRATGNDALALQNLSVIVTAAASATCAPIAP